jgi:hypothetical protein
LGAAVSAPAFGAKGRWTPLLEGERREAVLPVVDEIASVLAELRPEEGSATIRDAPALAVLFAYLSRARGSAQDGARAARYLESPLVPSFHAGLAAGSGGLRHSSATSSGSSWTTFFWFSCPLRIANGHHPN